MHQNKILQKSLSYIEQNLKTDITAEELANMAGYSTYHFYRLFSLNVGSSIANYILKRRLDHVLYEISSGRTAIDVVMEYGFDTYAGFYKAFCKMYGCSPKKYVKIYGLHKPKQPEVIKMYTHEDLKKVLTNWDIQSNLPIKNVYIVNGTKVADNVWQIGEDYFLKTGNRTTLIKNITIAKALHKQGFTSTLPVLTKSGDEFVDDKEIFVLTNKLKGEPLSKEQRMGEHKLEFMREAGVGIAKLHNALKSVQSDICPDEVNLYQNISEWALSNVQKQNEQWSMGIDGSFFENYLQEFGKLYPKLPKQLIHRDPNPGNILFDGDKVSGFIDFDLSESNVRLWDVCYCCTGLLSEDTGEMYAVWVDILSEVLHGYDSVNKLTKGEKQSVFYVVCSIQMICVAWFESQDEYKELAKTNRKMLQYIIQSKEKINRIF